MPRRLLTENVNWDDSYFQLAYTVDALDLAVEEGDKELSALAKAARPLLDRYDALDVDRRKRERAVNKSHVRVKRRDLESDALVRTSPRRAPASTTPRIRSPLSGGSRQSE